MNRDRTSLTPVEGAARAYLDPEHGTNNVRTLVVSQLTAAAIGWALYAALGPGYLARGGAMVATIVLMIVLDAVHPALRAGNETNLVLFGLAVGMTAVLVVLQRIALWLLARARMGRRPRATMPDGATDVTPRADVTSRQE